MDAIDILGSILGKKINSSGRGGSILKDILGGGRSRQEPQYQEQSHSQERRRSNDPFGQSHNKPIGSRHDRSQRDSSSLEDLLGVAVDHNRRSRDHYQQHKPPQRPQRRQPQFTPEQEELNEQSKVLIRAMVNATKADGRVDKQEQEGILQHLDHVSQEEIDFLRKEFNDELCVRDFTWSVPIGMEEQVYAISLCAINLDQNSEAKYLSELAHGLRLEPALCNQIHRKYGVPEIFR